MDHTLTIDTLVDSNDFDFVDTDKQAPLQNSLDQVILNQQNDVEKLQLNKNKKTQISDYLIKQKVMRTLQEKFVGIDRKLKK